jgi:XTP/dITP diphosphohydrolase
MSKDITLEKNFLEFFEIVKRLRKECPWDKEQTHESLRRCILEESYEVLESIDNNDINELKKELGDVLLQVVFHASIGEENKTFSLNEIINLEKEKLIARHPHIFGNVKVSGSEEVKSNWEKLKRKEGRQSILDGVPNELPALFKAYRIQEKAAKVGFDWKNPKPVYDKILEEIGELKHNIENGLEHKKIEDEFGDVLFSIVNYARFLKINPEDALRNTIKKFIYRFKKIEEHAKLNGIKPEDMTLDEMDVIWNKAKGDINEE